MYDQDGTLQYIGISRKIAASVGTHLQSLGEEVSQVRFVALPAATKDELTAAWRTWVEEAVDAYKMVPAGNTTDKARWQGPRAPPQQRPDIRLTPGKGLDDVSCSLHDLIDHVVKSNKVVAFVKGSRMAPQCGFSQRVLAHLLNSRVDFEVVNVLDEVYNPGLREAIKSYSAWPTIPQIYVNGEFIGGADIIEELSTKGTLLDVLTGKSKA